MYCKKIISCLFASSLLVSGGGAIHANSGTDPDNTKFDFVEKAQEQGYTAEAQSLKQYIQTKADDEGKTYEEVANEIFAETQKAHAQHSDQLLYNDLVSENVSARSVLNSNAEPVSSVLEAYGTKANMNHMLLKIENVVPNNLDIQYGVDTVIYNSGSFRQFISINASTAFVLPYGNGIHKWNSGFKTATLVDPLNVSFRAYGNLESEVSYGLSAGFSAAGFSISTSNGTTVTLRKTHQIAHNFSIY
ncbi:hypothetical protein B9G55_12630 [Saccharibacillus sp. O16]|nr:hypothetical protein B9G55_12630 [Saccharibacillus sp. O16]